MCWGAAWFLKGCNSSRLANFSETSISVCMEHPALAGELWGLHLFADSFYSPGRGTITCRAAAAPGWGCRQEPCSLLLLQGRPAADPARAERAQDQPVPGAGGAGLLPAVGPAVVAQDSASCPCSHPWPI